MAARALSAMILAKWSASSPRRERTKRAPDRRLRSAAASFKSAGAPRRATAPTSGSFATIRDVSKSRCCAARMPGAHWRTRTWCAICRSLGDGWATEWRSGRRKRTTACAPRSSFRRAAAALSSPRRPNDLAKSRTSESPVQDPRGRCAARFTRGRTVPLTKEDAMMQIVSLARPTLLALVLAFGGLAAAQADDAMKPDAMKSDDMNGGAMKSGAMKNTKPMKGGAMMKSGAMKGDAMKKDDAMKSDAVTPKN